MINRDLEKLLMFFVLSFMISWFFWWPELIDLGINPTITGLLGAFGPSLAAVIVITMFDGRPGITNLGVKLRKWRIHPKWYAFVLLYQAVLILTITIIHVILGGEFPDYGNPLFVTEYPIPEEAKEIPFVFYILPVFLQQTLIGSSMGEELGWRGLALPQMQEKWGALTSSVGLGIIWGIWHLPLWLNPDDIRSTIPFWQTVVGTMATAIIFTWIFNQTEESLVLALLLHTGINTTSLFLASADVDPLLNLVVSLIFPIFLIWKTGGKLGYDKTTLENQPEPEDNQTTTTY